MSFVIMQLSLTLTYHKSCPSGKEVPSLLARVLLFLQSYCLLWSDIVYEHVYMRPKVKSNQFEISIWGKISLSCRVTSLSAST